MLLPRIFQDWHHDIRNNISGNWLMRIAAIGFQNSELSDEMTLSLSIQL
jgi:hypothetical protein